jgi:hypothetical protein
MALIPHAAVGDKITAAKYNTLVDVANQQGMMKIIPTGVIGTSVISMQGQISVSAGTTLGADGIFTSAYTNYRLVMNFSASTSIAPAIRTHAGGIADIAANYDFQVMSGTSATDAAAQTLAASSWAIFPTGNTFQATIDLFGPATSAACFGTGTTFSTPNPMTAAAKIIQFGILHRLTTPFDGLYLTVGSGTMTGTIDAYGYNAG